VAFGSSGVSPDPQDEILSEGMGGGIRQLDAEGSELDTWL
jgi:hypothetical protein